MNATILADIFIWQSLGFWEYIYRVISVGIIIIIYSFIYDLYIYCYINIFAYIHCIMTTNKSSIKMPAVGPIYSPDKPIFSLLISWNNTGFHILAYKKSIRFSLPTELTRIEVLVNNRWHPIYIIINDLSTTLACLAVFSVLELKRRFNISIY